MNNIKLKKILTSHAFKAILRPIAMMILSIVVIMIFLGLSGYKPTTILVGLQRAFTKDISGTIRWATPMILAGIAVCIPFKAQVFNLGVDGQIYLGAIGATAVALALPPQTGAFGIILTFLVAALCGALFALIPAALNVFFGADMVVSTMMLNFIGELFASFMASVVMQDPEQITQMRASRMLPESMWLPRFASMKGSANIGIFIAVAIAVAAGFIFYKTTLGYEIKVVGTNPTFARYGGMKPNRVIFKTMALSGAVAGVIGAAEITAVQHRLISSFNPGIGFDGVVVALLASNNPLGVIASGFYFGALKNAGNVIKRVDSVPEVVTEIVMAIIILTISIRVTVNIKHKRRESGKNGHTD